MRERIRQMLVKEIKQVRRDPRMRAVILVVPILQSLVFGYAVTTDVRNVRTAVYDTDRTPESRELVSRFIGSGYFREVVRVADDAAARDAIDRGTARVVLHMRPGFGEAVRAGKPAQVQLIIDGTDSNTAGLVLNYAAKITAGFNRSVMVRRTGREIPEPGADVRAWFNANLESRNFYVPGVIALLVTLTTLLLTSMSIVREKEIGTIEQIIVSPIRKSELIIGKSLPFAIIAFVNVVTVTLIAALWFRVPIRGSILLLLACTALFLMTAIGMGLLISTIAGTQQQAMLTSFFYFMPAVLLSGFIFPIANMPLPVQWLTYVNPLRYFLVIIRGIFLKGIGVTVLWPQMVALALLGAVTLFLATRAFRKQLT